MRETIKTPDGSIRDPDQAFNQAAIDALAPDERAELHADATRPLDAEPETPVGRCDDPGQHAALCRCDGGEFIPFGC